MISGYSEQIKNVTSKMPAKDDAQILFFRKKFIQRLRFSFFLHFPFIWFNIKNIGQWNRVTSVDVDVWRSGSEHRNWQK